MQSPLLYALLATALLAGSSGCALIIPEEKGETTTLPTPTLPPDCVVLEVAFARLPLNDLAGYEEIWNQVDEQHFPPEVRRSLTANGVRCGLVGMQLPPKLKEVLDASSQSLLERGEDASQFAEEDRGSKRIQCRSGRRAKIIVAPETDSLSLLLSEENRVRGLLLSDAQCLFGLKAYPQGDGRARIDLTPEVEHGEMKTQFVGRDGSVLPQLGRDRVVMDKLKLEATLPPGHVLMLSATPEAKGLGGTFFTESESGTTYRRVLLIRLAVTQHDDLFAPDQMVSPLASPVD